MTEPEAVGLTQPDLHDLLARIHALTAEVTSQRDQIASQQAQIDRLSARPASAQGPSSAPAGSHRRVAHTPNRRAAHHRLAMGAAAAVGLLAATRTRPRTPTPVPTLSRRHRRLNTASLRPPKETILMSISPRSDSPSTA